MPTKPTLFCPKGHSSYRRVGRNPSRCNQCEKEREANKSRPQYLINYRQQNWKRQRIMNEAGNQFAHIDYDRLYQIQGGKCAFPGCGRHQSEIKESLNVDHEHSSGKVRSLLCNSCNKNLVASHTIESAERLLSYLRQHAAF